MNDGVAVMAVVGAVSWFVTWLIMTLRCDEAQITGWRQGWLDRGAYENERHKSASEEQK